MGDHLSGDGAEIITAERIETVLTEHGLLDHLSKSVYVITDRGEAYLYGEIDLGEDRPDEPNGLDTETETNGGKKDEAR